MAALKPQVRLLAFVSLLNDSASEVIYPLLPVFLTSVLGATPVTVGVIEGAADGLASILKYFAGSISDKLPRRKPLVVVGYGLAAASRALIAVAGRWPSVLAARLLDRTGKGVRSAPRDAIIADVTSAEDRGRAFGFQRALDHTGAVVGPLIALAPLQLGHVSMRNIFLIAVIPGAVGVVLLAVGLKEEGRAEGRGPRAEPGASLGPQPSALGPFLAIGLFALANSSDAFLILQAHAAG